MKEREKDHCTGVDSERVQMTDDIPTCVHSDRDLSHTRTNSVRKCSRVNISRHKFTLRNTVICLLIFNVFMSDFVEAMPRTMFCDTRIRCLNGGKLQIPDTSFGFCFCSCKKGFAGIRCQFNRKRNRRIRRLNRLKRLVRLRNDFENLIKNRRHDR